MTDESPQKPSAKFFPKAWLGLIAAACRYWAPDFSQAPVDDVVQDVSVKILAMLSRDFADVEFTESSEMPPDIRRSLRGLVRTAIKTQRRQEAKQAKFKEQTQQAVYEEKVGYDLSNFPPRFFDCLAKLSPEHLQLMTLRHVKELKPRQIAKQLGQTNDSVRGKLKRALAQLRSCVSKEQL